ncbi:DUF3592 domain-containing protein [Rhizobium sp. CF142]|uniref:DUF3592 domain-containing protein n=1 Tax=Rhizobium sp. CF142 TaxID=1144314 RepID=UPI00026EF7FB|nr:DUF3592 domain-containing protein [Rhizobium sp. CF142]EJJ28835.1 hypothetical protein PMI11_02918 [Rhizobium sp. CF142]
MYEALWIVSIAAFPLILFGLRVREIYFSNIWRPATAKITACYPATIVDVDSLFVDMEFVLDGVPYRKTEINTHQMRRDGFEPGSLVAVFVNPNDAGQVVLDKRDTNFLDAWARSFVTRFLSTSSRTTRH